MGNVADIRLTISVDGSSVKPATDEVAKAFGVLKAKTVAEINKQKSEINTAYEAIRKSGTVSAGEIGQAWAAKNKQIAELDKEMLAQQNGVFNTLKGCWLQLVGWATAAIMAIRWAWRLMEEAAAYQDQVSQLESLAKAYNTTADSIISDIENITGGMISMSGIVAVAVQGMTRGLDPAQLKELAKYADAVGDTMKTSAAEGFRALAEGAALGRERTLENIVGVIDLNAVLGDQVNKMNDAEKAQARMNIMLERLRNVYPAAGNETKSFGDKMEALTATVKNLQLWLGTGLIRATAGAMAAFQWLSASFLTLASGFWHALRPIEWLLEKLKLVEGGFVKGAAEEAWRLAQEQTGKAADNFETMIASSEKLAAAMAKPRNEMDNFTDSTKNLNDLNNALKDFELQISGMDPALSETDKALMKLDADYDTLIEKIDRMTGLSQSAKDAMKDSALQLWGKGRDLIWKADAKRAGEEAKKAFEGVYQAREALEKNLTEARASELDKRMLAEDDWAQKQRELLFQSGVDYETFQARMTEVTQIAADRKKKFTEDHYRQIQDATLAHQMALIDLQEKNFAISPADATSLRLGISGQQLDNLRQQYDSLAGLAGKELERLAILSKITETERAITDLKQQQKKYTGTFTEGLEEGIRFYIASAKTVLQQGEELAARAAEAMKSAFSDFFDVTSDNFMKFGKLAISVLTSIQKKMADMLSDELTNYIMKGIKGLISGSGATYSTNISSDGSLGWLEGILNLSKEHSGGLIMHSGGLVPKFHSGGLSSDERAAILQTGEYVVSRKGVQALDRINSGNAGNNINVLVNVENKSSQEVDAKAGEVRFDGKQYVTNIILEDAYRNGPISQTLRR